jgi:hypothetical protein
MSGEHLFLGILAFLMIAPPFLAGLKTWGWFMVTLVLLVLCTEGIAVAVWGKTISRMFWELNGAHPRTAWAVLIAWTGAYFGLVWHLGGKKIERERGER